MHQNQNSNAASSRPIPKVKVLVPIANDSDPKMSVITANVLRRAGANVTVALVGSATPTVKGSRGFTLVGDTLVAAACQDNSYDLIALPGGWGSANFRTCQPLESKANRHHVIGGRLLSAICVAPFLALAPWGLLHARKATVYPTHVRLLSAYCTALNARVVEDGNLITAAGPGAEMEYALLLIERLFGKPKAQEICKELAIRSNHGDEYSFKEYNPINWRSNMAAGAATGPRVLVVVADGIDAIEAVTIIDTLRVGKATVDVASLEGDSLEVMAFLKVKIVADMLLHQVDDQLSNYDIILLPGGVGCANKFLSSNKLVNMLKNCKKTNKPYGAIGTTPALVLEPLGLLDGKKATTHLSLAGKLADSSACNDRVVIDCNLVTSMGPGSAMEFSYAILEKFFGREKIVELSKSMVFIRGYLQSSM